MVIPLSLCLTLSTSALANGMGPHSTLYKGQHIASTLGKYTLIMQTDGSLVYYRQDGTRRYSMAKYGHMAVMQGDGNFVEYSSGMHPLWSTGTYGNPNSYLAIQDDGNLVVYTPTGTPLWNIGADVYGPNDPSKVADVVGRDLNYGPLGWLGHVGIWDGKNVLEVVSGAANAARYVSLNHFKDASPYWGKASFNVPNEIVSNDCAKAYCGWSPGVYINDVEARVAAAQRAYQILLIGADYTTGASYQEATPGTEYTSEQRGMYRCDTYVFASLKQSTYSRYYRPYTGATYPVSAAMQTWRSRYNSLVMGMTPKALFDKLRTFQ